MVSREYARTVLFFTFFKMNSNSCKLRVTPILLVFFVSALISCKVTGSSAQNGQIAALFMECFHIKLHTCHFLNKHWAHCPFQIQCTTQSL